MVSPLPDAALFGTGPKIHHRIRSNRTESCPGTSVDPLKSFPRIRSPADSMAVWYAIGVAGSAPCPIRQIGRSDIARLSERPAGDNGEGEGGRRRGIDLDVRSDSRLRWAFNTIFSIHFVLFPRLGWSRWTGVRWHTCWIAPVSLCLFLLDHFLVVGLKIISSVLFACLRSLMN